MSKKNSKSKFWMIFRIYAVVLVALIVVLLIYTYNSMKKYESKQPEVVMDKLIAELEAGDISSVDFKAGNKFEDVSELAEDFVTSVTGRDLDYKMKMTTYDAMSYSVISGDNVVATVNLKADNHKGMFSILTICDWEVDKVNAEFAKGENKVNITMPSDYKAYVNGVELGKDEQNGELKSIEGLDFVAQYTAIPQYVSYKVEGLLKTPVVKILDRTGAEVDLSAFEDLSNINIDYTESEMPLDLKEYVSQAAKDYSNFFSKDLPGCSQSTAGIDKYFPTGSQYVALAENYRLHDMWMYSAHKGTEFIDFKVDDYTVYSDTLFSCTVSFTKRMVLNLNNEERKEYNDQIYYYVNIDGKWLIAAMMDNVK